MLTLILIKYVAPAALMLALALLAAHCKANQR